jgi:hypothetical protein
MGSAIGRFQSDGDLRRGVPSIREIGLDQRPPRPYRNALNNR